MVITTIAIIALLLYLGNIFPWIAMVMAAICIMGVIAFIVFLVHATLFG